MIADPRQRYRSVQAETSTPGRILLALYDGALRLLGEARDAHAAGRVAERSERISRVIAILGELGGSLDHGRAPDLCAHLDRLYLYLSDRLLQVGARNDATAIDEAVRLLAPLRDAWRTAVREAEGGARARP